ncbi:MAG: hypothetical protein LBU32_19650 [Clostridiales bacterium]|jgi:hypothetical protein|nr:hypothetical protein [Clostridiales bacterium]
MDKRKSWECRGFILCRSDALIPALAALLLAAGRLMSLWQVRSYSIVLHEGELADIILENAAFFTLPAFASALRRVGAKGRGLKGLAGALAASLLLSGMLAVSSLTTAFTFSLCCFVLLLAAIHKNLLAGIRRKSGAVAVILCYCCAYAAGFASFVNGSAYRAARFSSILRLDRDLLKLAGGTGSFLMAVIRDAAPSLTGEASFTFGPGVTADKFFSRFAANPHFMLAYAWMKFGAAFGAAIALIGLGLCACLWRLALRQREPVRSMACLAAALGASARFSLHLLANTGVVYLNAQWPLVSGTSASATLELLMYALLVGWLSRRSFEGSAPLAGAD